MNELIKVVESTVGSEVISTVNARELYAFLEVETKFTDWISRRVKDFDFAQDTDFVAILNSEFSPPRKDYHIILIH